MGMNSSLRNTRRDCLRGVFAVSTSSPRQRERERERERESKPTVWVFEPVLVLRFLDQDCVSQDPWIPSHSPPDLPRSSDRCGGAGSGLVIQKVKAGTSDPSCRDIRHRAMAPTQVHDPTGELELRGGARCGPRESWVNFLLQSIR